MVIGIFTVVFLETHPFHDGDGQLSRMLITLLLLRAGYAYLPYSSLESLIEKTKDQDYLALRQTAVTVRSAKPNWQTWVGYFLKARQRHKQRLATKIERERLMIDTLPKLTLQILQFANVHGKLTNAQIVKMTRANRNTVKKHLQSIVLNNHHAQHGTSKGTWYERA
ncbi:MAG: Fic family protein [Gammaproteobacteria bacterium]